MKKSICVFLIFIFTHAIARAQMIPPSSLASMPVHEYYVGRDLGKPLITVNVINGVGQPGVYHVPIDTDIAQLLSYAGGASERSDLTGLTIRHGAERGAYHITELNLEKALKDQSDLFRVRDQDTVQIQQKVNVERISQWAVILSAVASVVLSAYLIENLKK